METQFNNESLEILGCGIFHDDVLRNANIDPTKNAGWAFGIGIDRWAMKLFGIPDIKLMWSNNPRFLRQFKEGQITKFVDYGKQPICYKDVSFWINCKDLPSFSENEIFEIARNVAGDLIENIQCRDIYEDKKHDRISRCYRIAYSHRDRVLTNQEVDEFNKEIRKKLSLLTNIKLR